MPVKEEGTSIRIRPDAISLDHRTAFSYGPVALQDNDQGLIVKAWRIYVQGNDLILEEDVGGEWGNPIVLFTFLDGSLVTELSLAFNQNAEAVFAAELAGEVYVYRYNALTEVWVFESFGPGRTPRITLDTPHAIDDSDLQLFYVSIVLNSLVVRTQRENFQTERVVIPDATNLYLEKALPSKGYRLSLVLSERLIAPGQYQIKQFFSKLLPIEFQNSVGPLASMDSLALLGVVKIGGSFDDQAAVAFTVDTLGLREPIIEALIAPESLGALMQVDSLALRAPIIEVEPVSEGINAQLVVNNLYLVEVVIETQTTVEEANVQFTVDSLSLGA